MSSRIGYPSTKCGESKLTDSEIIGKKLEQYGFKNKTERERRINLVNYVQNILGLDVCEAFDNYLVKLITDIESDQLTSDTEEIKKGNLNVFGTRTNLKNEIEEMLLGVAKNSIRESLSSEIKQSEEPQPQPFSDEFIEAYLAISNQQLYRAYKVSKGKKDPLLSMLQTMKTINKLTKPSETKAPIQNLNNEGDYKCPRLKSNA